MGGIILEYESGLSSQEGGASFSIKLQTIEKNPPGPPYGELRPTKTLKVDSFKVEEHLEGAWGEISNSIVHTPVLRVTPVQCEGKLDSKLQLRACLFQVTADKMRFQHPEPSGWF